jgi:hypothetical protein
MTVLATVAASSGNKWSLCFGEISRVFSHFPLSHADAMDSSLAPLTTITVDCHMQPNQNTTLNQD